MSRNALGGEVHRFVRREAREIESLFVNPHGNLPLVRQELHRIYERRIEELDLALGTVG